MDRIEQLLHKWENTRDLVYYNELLPLVEAELAKDPKNPRMVFDLGFLQQTFGLYHLGEAEKTYEKLIDLAPKEPHYHIQLIYLRAQLRKHERSIERYKRAIEQRPMEPEGFDHLARAYCFANQLPEAEKTVQAGLKISPENAYLLQNLGEIKEKQGLPEEAIDCWKRVKEIDRTFVDVYFSSAAVHERLGRLEEAVQEWEAIVDLFENHYHTDTTMPQQEIGRVRDLLRRSRGEKDTG
jgi:tetratricopeptide (TPR) repeat protein